MTQLKNASPLASARKNDIRAQLAEDMNRFFANGGKVLQLGSDATAEKKRRIPKSVSLVK